MTNAWIVGDLAFGDSGKGVEVARLTKKHGATLNVRYGGGANCAHNVVHDDFRHHTFAQFGSGSFYGADTYLHNAVRFDPVMYVTERNLLRAKGVKTNLYVHPDCLVVTPLHVLHSLRSALKHTRSSTGAGVGAAARYADLYPGDELRVNELAHPMIVRAKMKIMRERLDVGDLDDETVKNMAEHLIQIYYHDLPAPMFPSEIFQRHSNIVFEGHQGALLDSESGFKPYVTSSRTTMDDAIELANVFSMKYTTIGVMRSYMTRHGNGPLFTEADLLTQRFREAHNKDGDDHLQGKWRCGWLDLELIWRGQQILSTVNVDEISISHMDKWSRDMLIAGRRRDAYLSTPQYAYEDFASEEHFLGEIERVMETPITVIGRGKRVVDREERT